MINNSIKNVNLGDVLEVNYKRNMSDGKYTNFKGTLF